MSLKRGVMPSPAPSPSCWLDHEATQGTQKNRRTWVPDTVSTVLAWVTPRIAK